MTLSGEVSTAAEKARVEQMVKTIPGVTEVVNGIAVNPRVKSERRTPQPPR